MWPFLEKKNYSFSVDLSGGETGDLGDGGAPGEDGDHQEWGAAREDGDHQEWGAPGEDGDHQEWGAPESQLRRGDMWVGEMYKEQ